MNALQIAYVVVLAWLTFSTVAWAASQLDNEPFTWRQCAIWTPVTAVVVGGFFATAYVVIRVLVYIGEQLG